MAIAGSEEISAGVVKLRRLADRREMDVKREEIGVAAQALLMDADYE